MKLGSYFRLMPLMLFILLVNSLAQPITPPFEGPGARSENDDHDVPTPMNKGSDTPIDTYQQGFDNGYKVGYLTGYHIGGSDTLKNVTTNMTKVFETIGIEKTPKEETKGERSLTEIYLSLGLLLFGLILALLQTAVVIKKGTGWERNSIRLIGLTLVLTLGAVLLPVGYSEQQVAPLMGLLGIVAGYLLAGIDYH